MRALRRIAARVRQPVSAEKRALLAARWASLPPALRSPWQAVGRQLVHCGYTLGPAYCSFGCSHCYLPANANRVPLPTLAEMKAQIDDNRRLLGPDGALQITGGDVVDAYLRSGRPQELIEVVRYANDAGVVPMVMTHGQGLLDDPDYLARLVTEGGLRKVALHIDLTQAGRPGFPRKALRSEAELHPLRDRFVDLVHQVRRRTGKRLGAAHTVTVTAANLDGVGEILRWLIAEPRRLEAFNMVSFQTEAEVGRTRMAAAAAPVTPEAVWSRVSAALGVELARDGFFFGHPDCSSMASLLVCYPERRVLDLMPTDAAGRAYWAALLEVFGGVGSRGASNLEANLQRLALIARRPSIVWHSLAYARHLARREGLGLSALAARLLSRRTRPLTVVMHNFMSAAEVRAGGDTVAERLAGCSFRGAARRADGSLEAVPMCAMNALERETTYAAAIARASRS